MVRHMVAVLDDQQPPRSEYLWPGRLFCFRG